MEARNYNSNPKRTWKLSCEGETLTWGPWRAALAEVARSEWCLEPCRPQSGRLITITRRDIFILCRHSLAVVTFPPVSGGLFRWRSIRQLPAGDRPDVRKVCLHDPIWPLEALRALFECRLSRRSWNLIFFYFYQCMPGTKCQVHEVTGTWSHEKKKKSKIKKDRRPWYLTFFVYLFCISYIIYFSTYQTPPTTSPLGLAEVSASSGLWCETVSVLKTCNCTELTEGLKGCEHASRTVKILH